jgi:hypothetical protein
VLLVTQCRAQAIQGPMRYVPARCTYKLQHGMVCCLMGSSSLSTMFECMVTKNGMLDSHQLPYCVCFHVALSVCSQSAARAVTSAPCRLQAHRLHLRLELTGTLRMLPQGLGHAKCHHARGLRLHTHQVMWSEWVHLRPRLPFPPSPRLGLFSLA